MEGPGTKSVQVTSLLKPEAPAGLCFVAVMMVAFGATVINSLPTACLCRHHSQRRQAQLRAHKGLLHAHLGYLQHLRRVSSFGRQVGECAGRRRLDRVQADRPRTFAL